MAEIVVKLPPGVDERLFRKKLKKLIEMELLMSELYGILRNEESWDELEGTAYDQAGAY
ncbi:MAG: hypothetical protein ABGW50_07140 [Thermococcus sp.]